MNIDYTGAVFLVYLFILYSTFGGFYSVVKTDAFNLILLTISMGAVSYTHLDVYKRQSQNILLENLGDVGGSWTQSAEGTRYSDSSGNNVVNGWQIIVGQWYYFDDNGYAVTGWQRINGQWYYFKENHTMATGWVQADGLSLIHI